MDSLHLEKTSLETAPTATKKQTFRFLKTLWNDSGVWLLRQLQGFVWWLLQCLGCHRECKGENRYEESYLCLSQQRSDCVWLRDGGGTDTEKEGERELCTMVAMLIKNGTAQQKSTVTLTLIHALLPCIDLPLDCMCSAALAVRECVSSISLHLKWLQCTSR